MIPPRGPGVAWRIEQFGTIDKCPHCERTNIQRQSKHQITCGGDACRQKQIKARARLVASRKKSKGGCNLNSCDGNKTNQAENVSGRTVADIAECPQQDEKLTKGGRIRSVIRTTDTHVEYYRSSIEVPWLQHPKRCTREGWECWASDAERWEEQ